MTEQPPRYPLFRWMRNVFLSGLVTFLPVMGTFACFVWLAAFTESLLYRVLQAILPEDLAKLLQQEHIPFQYRLYIGIAGIATVLAIIFVLGLFTKLWFVKSIVAYALRLLERIPLIKTIYGGIKDVIGFFFAPKSKDGKGQMVVLATLPGGTWKQLGIVTRTEFDDLTPGLRTELERHADGTAHPEEEFVAVYFPFSYQLGGFSYFIERSSLQPVPGMTGEEAMRYCLMAWMSSAKEEPPHPHGAAARTSEEAPPK